MKFLDIELSRWYYSDDGKYAARYPQNKPINNGAYFWIYDDCFNNYDIWHCSMRHGLPYKDFFEKIHDQIYYKDNYDLNDLTKIVDSSLIKINNLKLFI